MTIKALKPTAFPFFDYRAYSFSLGLETPVGIWLSGHTASEHSPTTQTMIIAHEGDLLAQARIAHAKIQAILQAAGLGLCSVVRLVDYVTPEGLEQYEQLRELRQELFGDHSPVISTVVVHRLLRPSALIEIEAVACPDGGAMVSGGAGRAIGDVIYFQTQLPLQPGTNEIACPGDLVGQTQQVYNNTARLLQQAGLGFEHLVKTVEYLTLDSLPHYRDTAHIRRTYLGPHYPAATGIIMPRLAHPQALLQVDFVASRAPKRIINPGWSRYNQLTYAPATQAGHLLCLAGQGALNPETQEMMHTGDIVAQTRYIYANLMQVLEAAGAGTTAVVKTIEFVTPAGLPRYRETAGVRREYFSLPYPAATGIVCEALLRPDMLIEVDAWAIVP